MSDLLKEIFNSRGRSRCFNFVCIGACLMPLVLSCLVAYVLSWCLAEGIRPANSALLRVKFQVLPKVLQIYQHVPGNLIALLSFLAERFGDDSLKLRGNIF